MSNAINLPELLLIGVGGGGGALATAVRERYGVGLRLVTIDTDAGTEEYARQEKTADAGSATVLLGGSRLSGRGSGGDLVQARLAAQDDLEHVRPHLDGVRSAVVLVTLGGGTGGGVVPELARMLRDMGIATLCLATTPFGFEALPRRQLADVSLPLIRDRVDSLVTLPLDKLFACDSEARLSEARSQAEEFVATGITLLWQFLVKPGFINFDSERLRAFLINGGTTHISCAAAAGGERCATLLRQLASMPFGLSREAGAKANLAVLGILAGSDLRLAEVGELVKGVKQLLPDRCIVETGTVLDESYDGGIEVVLLAFEGGGAAAQAAAGSAAQSPGYPLPPVGTPALVEAGRSKRRGRERGSRLSHGATGRGRFRDVEPTLIDGQDFDVPTYARRSIVLER